MRFAVVQNDFVVNVIIANEEQKAEMETALDARLVDAAPFNLSTGDYYREGIGWTRNEEGEQIILTERPTYDELAAGLERLAIEARTDKVAYFDSLSHVVNEMEETRREIVALTARNATLEKNPKESRGA